MKLIAARVVASTVTTLMSAFTSLAHAQLIEIQWDVQQQFERSVDVEPGKFVEVCGKLTPNASVSWQFKAGAPLNFNVHYHEGKEVRFPAKADAQTQDQGVLDVKSEQDYCWMWSNKGTVPAKLSFGLKKSS